jgi:hypothetical protein
LRQRVDRLGFLVEDPAGLVDQRAGVVVDQVAVIAEIVVEQLLRFLGLLLQPLIAIGERGRIGVQVGRLLAFGERRQLLRRRC